MKKSFLMLLAIGVLCLASVSPAAAAEEKYPNKPINFIVPLGPGGMSDVTARLLAEKFREELGQPVLVSNKPGAAGVLGLRYGLSQPPDGYTVVVGTIVDTLTAPLFEGTEPFRFEEMSFIGSYMPQERVLFTTPDKPYKTFAEFIEYAGKHPGEISVGSGGLEWTLEIVKSIAVKDNLKLKYVPFKSGAEGSTAILGKHVDTVETGTGTPAFQSAREGKLIPLVNLGAGSVPFFPDVKSVAQLGYPFHCSVAYGMVLPAGTPEPVRKKLEVILQKVMQDPKVIETMTNMGLSPQFQDGKAFERVCREAVSPIPELINYIKVLDK